MDVKKMKAMAGRITETTYGGHRAIVMETEWLEAVLLPEIGAKLISLRYKPTMKEWLVDPGARPVKRPIYGSPFTDWDMSGWDEMCPTITSCQYPEVEGCEWKGTPLPDHGELWSVPWEVRIVGQTCVLRAVSRVLPYELVKTYSFPEPGLLRAEYMFLNKGAEPMAFLWTAHPQFVASPDTEIHLPASINRVACVHGGKKLKGGETVYDWPQASLENGENLSLNVAGSSEQCDSRKFYYPERVSEGWSALRCSSSMNYLICKVSPQNVPYLGIWIDEGKFNTQSVIALEPSTGYYDSLETAVRKGMVSIAKAGGGYGWHMDVVLGQGTHDEMMQMAMEGEILSE